MAPDLIWLAACCALLPACRPQGAFFLFSGDMRPKVKAENPDMKVTEVAKHIGELWKNISDKEKEK